MQKYVEYFLTIHISGSAQGLSRQGFLAAQAPISTIDRLSPLQLHTITHHSITNSNISVTCMDNTITHHYHINNTAFTSTLVILRTNYDQSR